MRHDPFFAIAAAALAALLAAGCAESKDEPEDATAPVAGAQIGFSAATPTGLIVSWGAGSDDATAAPDLRYKLVMAAEADGIDTVPEADAVAGADLAMDWTANASSALIADSPGGDICCFAVLVRDEAGNKALYSPQSVVLSASFDLTIYAAFPITARDGGASIVVADNGTGLTHWAAYGLLDSLGCHRFDDDPIIDTYFKEQRITVIPENQSHVTLGEYTYVLTGLVSGDVQCTVRDGGVFTLVTLP